MLVRKKKLDAYIKLACDLKQENETLKKQIAKIQSENDSVAFYKQEYQELAEQSKNMIEKYKVQLEKMEELENEYKKYLNGLKRSR